MVHSLYAVPEELRSLNCWVLWREGKVPYQTNGQMASVTNPETWNSFEACFNCLQMGQGYLGLGLVFHEGMPYSFIDLDNSEGDTAIYERQLKVYHEFNSYSEISPSGKGCHIIIKGKVPAGRRRSKIEIYSTARYATMTGNVYNNVPIAERQALLLQLWEQMGPSEKPNLPVISADENLTDEQIIEMALNASNGEKFAALHRGEFKGEYPSQSEADQAYMNIIAYYTDNKEQAKRIYLNSPLGKTDKTRKRKANINVEKAFDQKLPTVDFEGFKGAIEAKIKAASAPSVPESEPFDIELPPGMLGEIAQFIYSASPRPVKEIALAGAIGLMAGVCGRAYNINGTGLNQYVLAIAKTGRGKEAAAIGIDKLMNAIKLSIPTSSRFRGPAIINSGQALVKYLNTTSNCFVSILGEFGITISEISKKEASGADKMLYKMLLDLYNKSGEGQTFQASIYSNKDDSVGITESPAVTILGESTHKLFYGALNEDMISAGLLPRFLIIEYNGYRVPSNEQAHLATPSFQLVDAFGALVANAEKIMHSRKMMNITIEPDALNELRAFDKQADDKINNANSDIIEELWNRAHMKALRLAGLIAVGVNPFMPTVKISYVHWAIRLIENDIHLLSSKFESGEIGKNSQESRQVVDMKRTIKEYLTTSWESLGKYSNSRILHENKIIPYTYFSKRTAALASFRNDRETAHKALERTIRILLDSDYMREMNKKEAADKFSTTQRAFVITNMSLLE